MVKARRCGWCGDDPLYVAYHDDEWGVPERAPKALFERLVLEGMQAGLSWLTILKKREGMRARFFAFDPGRLAAAGEADVRSWLADPAVIRHRGKLEAMIANARAYLQLEDFSGFLWSIVDGAPRQNRWRHLRSVPSETAESRELARRLKSAGFRFVGPTTCYALMQSAGLVNDHLISCPSHRSCAEAWATLCSA
ncbi:MAG: DNA-3-methyladenine glycosylase I [Pseudomonadales bacterium]|nr:DNA-3-methyladenine glycosylase I [Pseudomonadales bacterium]NIX08689.1 DNA-3-methyladenine glycosylase I [Pseudomonadales bacterium]